MRGRTSHTSNERLLTDRKMGVCERFDLSQYFVLVLVNTLSVCGFGLLRYVYLSVKMWSMPHDLQKKNSLQKYSKHTSSRSIIKKTMKIIGLLLLLLLIIEGVRLIQLSKQRNNYKNYWQGLIELPLPANALVYVALGDSAAQSIGASEPRKGYVGLLAERLTQKTKRPVHIVNLSVTGARVQDVIDKQLPELQKLALAPDTVISLAVGSNDIRSFNADNFKTSMSELLAGIPKNTIVADVPYFGGGRGNTGEKNALIASRIISDLAQQNDLSFVELHEATKVHNSWRNYAADFFHPSDRAYQIWADAFWDVMERSVDEPQMVTKPVIY